MTESRGDDDFIREYLKGDDPWGIFDILRDPGFQAIHKEFGHLPDPLLQLTTRYTLLKINLNRRIERGEDAQTSSEPGTTDDGAARRAFGTYRVEPESDSSGSTVVTPRSEPGPGYGE